MFSADFSPPAERIYFLMKYNFLRGNAILSCLLSVHAARTCMFDAPAEQRSLCVLYDLDYGDNIFCLRTGSASV